MMESSPLAAMQPPPLPPSWGCRRDMVTSRPRYTGNNLFGTSSFNFRDMSMGRPQQDYFSGSHVRGSSPAASLAADLSQNFHIDQSPQLPTPRRSLFTTTNVFQSALREGATTPPIRWEGVTTPPIPSSSPGFANDSMDMSPLPHKLPYSRTIQALPTPATSDVDMTPEEPITSLPAIPSDTADSQPTPPSLQQRRKSTVHRPSLLRSGKFFSTNSVCQQIKEPANQLPPFKFGAGVTTTSISLSLDDIEDSPVHQRGASENMRPSTSRSRLPAANALNGNRLHGSPSAGFIRKPQCPVTRPRKQFRRSNSMFEHPADLLKQDKEEYPTCGLQSIMDVDDAHKLALPHFVQTSSRDGMPRISQETMINVLDGQYKDHFDEVMVVDCRFEYEFSGGHIDGAINHNDKEGLTRALFSRATPGRTLIVLHCEFSAHRAPLMAEHIRRQDRRVNESQYPKLTFPEVYILDGGYHLFYQNHSARCYPQNYVEMGAEGHEATCEREMDKLRRRGKLDRAVTYAFGQVDVQMEDSPTANGRTLSFNGLSKDTLDTRRNFGRRMVTY